MTNAHVRSYLAFSIVIVAEDFVNLRICRDIIPPSPRVIHAGPGETVFNGCGRRHVLKSPVYIRVYL